LRSAAHGNPRHLTVVASPTPFWTGSAAALTPVLPTPWRRPAHVADVFGAFGGANIGIAVAHLTETAHGKLAVFARRRHEWTTFANVARRQARCCRQASRIRFVRRPASLASRP